jgi:hypothetical protein
VKRGIPLQHIIHFTLIISLLLPLPALAIPAITCHCFTDRSFNPAQPALADPYFLATTQNSFFAAVFNADKKTIVMKKQRGVSSDDLWIAYWIASRADVSAETLLQAKQAKESWQEVVAPLRISIKTLGDRFATSLNSKASTGRLAEVVVDELFSRNKLLKDAELAAIRKTGASSQELIIATVIGVKMKQPVQQIYMEVKNGAKTWGSLLQSAHIDTKNMQGEIVSVLRLPAR